MKKSIVIFFLVFANAGLHAISANDTVVPWAVGLRIRENPGTAARVLGYLGLWERLAVVEVGSAEETIAGNTGRWVRVRRENGLETGWAFGHFLDVIDPDNFFPVLEYRGWAHSATGDGFGSREIYTLYNDGRRRQRLVLFWENRPIYIFDHLTVSENGRVIAFSWLDPATITRDGREGTVSGNRRLFVYNFVNHSLAMIDEALITQSDITSERWRNSWDPWNEEFFLDNSLANASLNSNGTRLFYTRNNTGIEVDLVSGNRTNHHIGTNKWVSGYIGNYVLLDTWNDRTGGSDFTVYDPATRGTFSGLRLFDSNPNSDAGSRVPVALSRDGRLVIEERIMGVAGIVMHDLRTGQQQWLGHLNPPYTRDEFDRGIHHSRVFGQDHYYIISRLSRRGVSGSTISIRRVDYGNNVVSQNRFDNVPSRLTSFSSRIFIGNTGIVEFQHGQTQAWMIVYTFDNRLLEYRFDDRIYRGAVSIYLMNND